MSVTDIILAQAEELIISAVKAQAPEVDLRPTTPQYDIYVRPILAVVASIMEQVQLAERKRTPLNWSEMTTEEMDAIAARYFVTRGAGNSSSGSIRIKLKERSAVNLTPSNIVTQGDLVYHPITPVAKKAEELTQDPILGYFYTDVAVRAEAPGSKYDAPVGVTFSVDAFEGDKNLIETVSSSPIQGGVDEEGNEDLYQSIIQSQTVRNLINPASVDFVLNQQFKGVIEKLLVIGYQEPEMRRDLRSIVDPVLGTISIHMGNVTDVYVQTPIMRQVVEMVVPQEQSILDMSDYRALIKVHSVTVKGTDDPIYYSLVDQNVNTRYSAIDEVKLFVDPAATERTLLVDLSYAPDVVAINDYVNSPEVRVTLANILVRYFIPVFLSGVIYVEGGLGKESAALVSIGRYTGSITGNDPLVVSKVTEAVHEAGVELVHQDYELTAEVIYGDGSRLEITNDKVIEIPNAYELGFSRRLALYLNEGIVVTPIS